ncbi:MAG: hypothetical protein ABIO29_01520 [Sphingomicrobium sp.]
MTPQDIGKVFAAADHSFERAIATSARTNATLTRADDVMTRIGSRDGAARAAARRERQRLNAGFGRTAKRVAMIIAVVWLATVVIGFVNPIGLFGLIAAIVIGAILVGGTLMGSRGRVAPALPAPDLPSALLVDRLDSYLYRARPALPAPAQAEIDQMLSALPSLKPTLERVGAMDPAVQDARRLMGTHLPNLIDRYLNVPAAYRGDAGDDDVSVDERLVEALRAGRQALDDAGKQLAKGDVAAFETQGRFIESRYGEEPLDR